MMPKAYWIARVDITNAEKYPEYVKDNAAAFTKYGAKFLVRGGAFVAVEGEARQRNVVIEFPDYQTAADCWNSPEYMAAKAKRDGNCIADVIIIEGYEG